VDKADVVGRPTGSAKVTVERGPIAAHAAGFDAVPAPPTFAFSAAQHWGKFPEDQPDDPTGRSNPLMEIIGSLMAGGGMVLHGEQEFTYHQPIVAGDELTCEGQVVDLYSKESSNGRTMTFLVTEDVYRNAAGEAVLTSRMNLIHRA